MSAPDGGEGFHRALDLARDAWAIFREVWAAFLTPAALAWFGWRKWSTARADDKAKGDRTEQQRRDDAFAATFARVDEKVKQHVEWLETRAKEADAGAKEADARADAADRERWRMELWVRDFEHALNNARMIADDARAKAALPPAAWQHVPRPKLPGDPA